MSETASSSPVLAGSKYQLSDDLARMCLPAEYREPYRLLAWANSLCFFFLVIGIIGLRPPKIIRRPLSAVTESAPVVFTPPAPDQPKPVEQQPDEPQPQDTPIDTPTVVTMVAPADAKVAFSVPVQGAVAIAPAAHLATPPPPGNQVAPRPSTFNQGSGECLSCPSPMYPGVAQRNHYQGTVEVEFHVDASGNVASAKVNKTSGFPVLDQAAVAVVERWRFPPGRERFLLWPCIFKLQ